MPFTFVKFIIGGFFIGALFYMDIIDFALLSKAFDAPATLALSFTCLLSTVFIGALRWKLLMQALNVGISYGQSLNYTFIGQFFNVFLPGAYGGDFIRGGLVYRQNKGQLGEIMMSSLVDRLTGLVGLLVIALAVLAFIPSDYQFSIGIIVISAFIAGLVLIVVALKFQNFFRKVFRLFPSVVEKILLNIFDTIVKSLEIYQEKRRDIAVAVALSIAQYIAILQSLYILGISLELGTLSWTGYFVSGAAGLFANAIPISPGGLGIGEAAFAQIATLLTSEHSSLAYGSVFLLLRSLTLGVAVIGIIPFLLYQDAIAAVKNTSSPLEKG